MNEVRLPEQHRVRGWILRVAGLIMRLAGSSAIIFGVLRARTSQAVTHNPYYHGLPWYVNSLIYLGVTGVGTVVFRFGLIVSRHARRHLVQIITSASSLAPGSYVLYLRPFTHDRNASGIAPRNYNENLYLNPFGTMLHRSHTYEERLSRMFREFGPMVTVGQPGEALPTGSGAGRTYLPPDDWKDTVGELIDNARLVILSAGPGPGTVWEYVEVLRRGEPSRLLVLVTDPDDYRLFKAATVAEAEGVLFELKSRYGDFWQPPILPDLPRPANPKATSVFYFRAMIYFSAGWEPHLTYFDKSAVKDKTRVIKKYSTERLRPVMTHLRNGAVATTHPPRTARHADE